MDQDELLEHYFPYQKEQKYVAKLRKAKESKDEDLEKQIKWELLLLNKTLGFVSEITDRWKWALENLGEPLPIWNTDAIKYYEKRTKLTKNPLDKARYCYALWCLIKPVNNKQAINYAKQSADLFLETAKIYIQNKWYVKSHEITPFFFKISMKICQRLNYIESLAKATTELRIAIDKELKDGEGLAHILRLIRIFSEFSIYLSYNSKIKDTIDILKIAGELNSLD